MIREVVEGKRGGGGGGDVGEVSGDEVAVRLRCDEDCDRSRGAVGMEELR